MSKYLMLVFLPWLFFYMNTRAQCLSSVNPVGGTDNLLVLEKNAFRVITFYKFGQGSRYYEGSEVSGFNLIDRAFYNYMSAILGYGIHPKVTLELETGYFFNKTQEYNVDDGYKLKGKGLSNFVLLVKNSLITDHVGRFYVNGTAGIKIPSSGRMQYVDNVRLPVEVQPTMGAFGSVLGASAVKEKSATGMRYFLTARWEAHGKNREDYRPGNNIFTSVYISKHLMYPWLKGDWTAIMQLKNEVRTRDRLLGQPKDSSGSVLFFLVPQINYVFREKWYISALVDVPVWQYFNGTQLGAASGLSFIVSRAFSL